MFDYKLIRAFAMVVQEEGFEKASLKMHISQSAISQRVKLLEEQFGQILLLRTTPPVPTDSGKKVLKLYHQIKHIEDDFKRSLSPEAGDAFISIPIGVNADSLDTWFFDAIQPVLDREKIVLDLFVDDQDQTHRLLRDGKVLACISTRQTAIQGCRIEKIGNVSYGMYASPQFIEKWFPDGLNEKSLKSAPGICFNRKDMLNSQLFFQKFNKKISGTPMHYVPSSAMFIHLLKNGIAYGMVPDSQSADLVSRNRLVDLVPDEKVIVKLYWHCWNLNSRLLQLFTRELVKGFTRIETVK